MINTLLNVRKIETQNIEINFEDVNVMSTIDKILSDFKNWTTRKSIKVSVKDIEIIQSVYADPNLFRQVIENLISNAIKSSPINSAVEIYGCGLEDAFEIHVKDNGPGISKAEQSKLFEKYVRLSARPTAGEDSIGIGLSLVKKLTELMKGKVFFTSELGKGSTFCVEFLLKKPFN
jgi:signal transduction histidine kinase